MRTYQNQFGDFTLDVPIPPTWQDDSWGNDVCPSWRVPVVEGGDLKVWVDYTDPTLREMGPETPRFSVDRYTVAGEDGESTLDGEDRLLSTDAWNDVLTYVLAVAFSRTLRSWLSPHDMEDRDHSSCASHDFCDANIAMEEAFKAAFGREPDTQANTDITLWNAAWDIAHKAGFKL